MKAIFKLLMVTGLLAFVFYSCETKGGNTETQDKYQAKMEVGVALYSFHPFSFSETLKKSEEARAKIVEGFFFHKLGGDYGDRLMTSLSEEEIQQLKAEVQKSGLDFKSLYAGGKSIEDWDRLFHICQELGGEFLVGEPEPELWDGLNELAGKYKMKVAIHEHATGHSRFWHPDSVLVALDGRPNFGACADLGHWARSGLNPVECLQKLEGHIISIHAKDVDESGNTEANDVRLGDGIIPYGDVVKELKRQQFTGPIYIECEHDPENNLEVVKYAIEYLQKLADSGGK